MTDTQKLLDKKTYKATRKTYTRSIKALQKTIKHLQKNGDIARLKLLIQKAGHISSFAGIDLYFNRIVKGDRTMSFNAPLDVQFQSSGDVYSTTTGGGSRPTLTRIAAGGLIAGPLGVIVGASAQKQKKSQTTVHDDRKIAINISGDGGYISSASVPLTNEQRARDFVEAVMNASHDYQKRKVSSGEYMNHLSNRLAGVRNAIGLTQKENELADLQKQKLALEKQWQKDKVGIKEEQKRIRLAEKLEKSNQKAMVRVAPAAQSQEMTAPGTSKNHRKGRSLRLPKRWYAKKPVVITLLVVFFPIGLFLMWKSTDWSKKTKWIVSGAIILLLAIGLIGEYNAPPSISLANAKADTISTNNAEYTLTGDVSSMKAATLTIDNQTVPLSKDSKFSYNVMLKEGGNTLSLVATNDNGTTKKSVTIQRTTQ